MGIAVEYNPDLALRSFEECKAGRRKIEECLPENMQEGQTYDFLKKDQRLYWLHGELPLLETKGNQKLSLPIASIVILEATHILIDGEIWTKGKYKVVEIFRDDRPRFNGFAKI
ncbi:MAG: hypothetical protein Q8O94_01440 [bacterium]|nr:hypothetical protein [bacterium]